MKPFTAKTPRYRIEGVKGEFFDVFNQRKNAIRAAVRMAVEYPGATFLVVKKVNLKSKIIFRFMIEADFEFEDVQEMYRGVIEAYQKKLDKTKYWRKSDGS
jgi:hypothetical protein